MKSYFDSIKDLANKVPESLADFSKPRDAAFELKEEIDTILNEYFLR